VIVDHNRVAKIVGCTARACEERIKKLRKLAKECGYETNPASKKIKKAGKGGKDGCKGKFIEDPDMFLYRKGIVSDDVEIKKENRMIKMEAVKREFGMFNYDEHGHEFGYEYGDDVKPFIKQQGMEDPSFLYAVSPSFRGLGGSSTYVNTVDGLEIPLGVPLEISCESPGPNCGRGKSPNSFTPPPVNGSQKPQWRIPSPQVSSPRDGHLELDHEDEIVEICAASKKNPMVINDDDGQMDISNRADQVASCIL
jgi:hypothetical protein